MFIASVRFALKPGTTLQDVTKLYEGFSLKYRDMPGLLTKYYVFGDGKGGAVYVWESRAAAERVYTAEWRKTLAERWGSDPVIEWLENPVTVDNVAGKIFNSSNEEIR